MSATFVKLTELVARRFDLESAQIRPTQDIFETLGVDSIQVLELLSELELAFGIEIPDYELHDVKTFGQLTEQIEKRL